MQEQSHKNDMSAALKGDFERLRKRREGSREVGPEQRPKEPATEPTIVATVDPHRSWLDRLRDRH